MSEATADDVHWSIRVTDSHMPWCVHMCVFFGLYFVLNVEDANWKKSYTFECFQKLFMEMGDKLSPKLLTFKK